MCTIVKCVSMILLMHTTVVMATPESALNSTSHNAPPQTNRSWGQNYRPWQKLMQLIEYILIGVSVSVHVANSANHTEFSGLIPPELQPIIHSLHQPMFIREVGVEMVSTFKYSENLTWTLNTTLLVKKAQQRLNVLRKMRQFGMSSEIHNNFYSCVVECPDQLHYRVVWQHYCDGPWEDLIRLWELHCPRCRPFTITGFTRDLPPSLRTPSTPTRVVHTRSVKCRTSRLSNSTTYWEF